MVLTTVVARRTLQAVIKGAIKDITSPLDLILMDRAGVIPLLTRISASTICRLTHTR